MDIHLQEAWKIPEQDNFLETNEEHVTQDTWDNSDNSRLTPITEVGTAYGGYTYGPFADLVNTRHLGSWVIGPHIR